MDALNPYIQGPPVGISRFHFPHWISPVVDVVLSDDAFVILSSGDVA